MKAKRKLNLILRSHKHDTANINIGDLVEVYIKPDKAKTGKWLSSRPVLTVHIPSGSLTVTGSNGRTITAVFEDKRHAIIEDDLASIIAESIDKIDSSLDEMLETCNSKSQVY